MSPGSQAGHGASGTSSPYFTPMVAPFAPRNRPNTLSKLRFSIITYTTRLIGQRVSRAATEVVTLGLATGILRPAPVHAYRVAPASARPEVRRNPRRENIDGGSCGTRR